MSKILWKALVKPVSMFGDIEDRCLELCTVAKALDVFRPSVIKIWNLYVDS